MGGVGIGDASLTPTVDDTFVGVVPGLTLGCTLLLLWVFGETPFFRASPGV